MIITSASFDVDETARGGAARRREDETRRADFLGTRDVDDRDAETRATGVARMDDDADIVRNPNSSNITHAAAETLRG